MDADMEIPLPLLGKRIRWPNVRAFRPECPNHGIRSVLDQLISLLGAFLVLLAYFANNRGWLGPRDRSYNLMNLVGGLLLLWVAVVDRRAGFMVLELTWALIAIPPLFRPRGREAPG
jgi:hypothetical protein